MLKSKKHILVIVMLTNRVFYTEIRADAFIFVKKS